jgi:hypothetical protein
MAASPDSWDFLLLRLRELRLPLLMGSANRTSWPTAERISDHSPIIVDLPLQEPSLRKAKRMTNHGCCLYSDSRSVGIFFQETRL